MADQTSDAGPAAARDGSANDSSATGAGSEGGGAAGGGRSRVAARYGNLARALRPAGGGDDAPTIHDAATAAVDHKGSGNPVDGDVAARVGAHLGADFSGVRVHDDPLSREASAAMGARAFAHGGDVFLGPGESGGDLGLMAHELTHVAQQGAAAQRAPQRQVQVGGANTPAEHEADAVSAAVTSGTGTPSALIVDDGPVQAGQMLKSTFISTLREQVTATVQAELGPLQSAIGCPFIDQYFSRYAGQPASAGEALIRRYAPATRSARTAADMIPAVLARVRAGVITWRDTGRPPADLPDAGGAAAAAAANPAAAPTAARALRTPDGAETLASLSMELGPGQALDGATASRMSDGLGVDVSSARIHTGPIAAAKASEHGATAFAVGEHVVMGASAPAAGTLAGDALLAHELAHVAQQRDAAADPAVQRAPIGGESAEAEHAADAAAIGAGVRAGILGDRAAARRDADLKTGVRFQRCVDPPPTATSRTGERWPGGPISAAKSVTHTLADYVTWVREVERAYPSSEGAITRLRRMYYSTHTGGAGPGFDRVIQTMGVSDVPMYAPVVSAATIDRIWETNAITTPAGQTIDVTHILADLDLRLSGAGPGAGVGSVVSGAGLDGLLTWTGDLASWFVEWNVQRRRATPAWAPGDYLTHLNALAASKVDKDDLLGDMDAEVMAQESTTMHSTAVSAGGGMAMPVIYQTADMPFSDMLQQYYGAAPATGSRGTDSNRFHHFIRGSQPRIPHSVTSSSPLRVALAGGAQAFISTEVSNTARVLIDHGYGAMTGTGGSPHLADVTTYSAMIDEIARRFVTFLTTGLASGDAPWP